MSAETVNEKEMSSDCATKTVDQKQKRMGLFKLWAEDISCVFSRDPAARSRFEVITTYPGVHAVMIHRVAHRLWKRNWRYLARFMAYISRAISNIDIHPGATEDLFSDNHSGSNANCNHPVGDGGRQNQGKEEAGDKESFGDFVAADHSKNGFADPSHEIGDEEDGEEGAEAVPQNGGKVAFTEGEGEIG